MVQKGQQQNISCRNSIVLYFYVILPLIWDSDFIFERIINYHSFHMEDSLSKLLTLPYLFTVYNVKTCEPSHAKPGLKIFFAVQKEWSDPKNKPWLSRGPRSSHKLTSQWSKSSMKIVANFPKFHGDDCNTIGLISSTIWWVGQIWTP